MFADAVANGLLNLTCIAFGGVGSYCGKEAGSQARLGDARVELKFRCSSWMIIWPPGLLFSPPTRACRCQNPCAVVDREMFGSLWLIGKHH